jgi:3-(3-hydroxy-phenyl)propionate hydroxylase
MRSEDRVIIAGGGPVGLVTALALAQRAIPVVVLEAEAEPLKDQRGVAFHPPTLEMLATLGIGDDLHALGLVVPVWQIRDRAEDAVIAAFDLGILADETPYPYRLHLGQHLLVPLLLDRLRLLPHAEIRFDCRVHAVVQDEQRVRVLARSADGAETALGGRWLIGADGAHSAVRKACGIAFGGFTWPERFLVTNIAMDLERLGYARTNYVADPERWAVVLKLSDADGKSLWRVTYGVDPSLPDTAVLLEEEVQHRLAEIIPGAFGPFPLRYAGSYGVHQRVAEKFRIGRVLLAGDAAHINNPVGGFGLNSGIHDAMNLAAKLARVWDGVDDCALLDQYVRQRRHANVAYVQASSIRNKRVIEERDPISRRAAYAELRTIAGDPALAKAYLLNTSMIASVRDAATVS